MLPHSLFLRILLLIGFIFQGPSGTCQVMHPALRINFFISQIKDRQYRAVYQEFLTYAEAALKNEHQALRDFTCTPMLTATILKFSDRCLPCLCLDHAHFNETHDEKLNNL